MTIGSRLNRVAGMRRGGEVVSGRRYRFATAALIVFAVSAAAHAQDVPQNRLHFTDSSTDRTPAKTAFPIYPRIARRDRIEGDATVCFKIDMRGKIRAVKVKNYTHRIFRRPALRAIKASSFEPVRPHEVLSTSQTCRTYRFRLEPLVVEGKTEQTG